MYFDNKSIAEKIISRNLNKNSNKTIEYEEARNINMRLRNQVLNSDSGIVNARVISQQSHRKNIGGGCNCGGRNQ